MGLIKGGISRLFETFLYFLAFLCSAVGLGIYSYFLSALADRNAFIPKYEKAVEGLTGAAVLYTICAVILTCCLGGVSFFAFIAIVLDILFMGAMIAVAILTRHGASSCHGIVNTPLGIGNANAYDGFGKGFGQGGGDYIVYGVKLGTACRLNTAVFAVSIIAAFLFLCTALMQLVLVRSHKKENRFGPSPANGYTAGSGKRRGFWNKKRNARDAELGTTTGGLAAPAGDYRPSHETGYTGTTVGGHGAAPYDKVETGTATNY